MSIVKGSVGSRLGDLWSRYVYVYSYEKTEKQFMEVHLDERPYQHEWREMKEIFMDQVRGHPKEKYLMGKFESRLFDTVDRYVVVEDFFVPNYLPHGNIVAHRPFLESMQIQPEDITPDYHNPTDLTYEDLERAWGLSGEFLAVREKKNGTPGYAVGDVFRSCFVEGLAPHGVELVEFTSDGVFKLFPYGGKEIVHQGVIIKPHPWEAPHRSKCVGEGIVILTPRGERKCRFFPTVDVLEDGTVWEICYDGERRVKLRPRGTQGSQERYLDKKISLRYVPVPDLAYPVLEGRGEVRVHQGSVVYPGWEASVMTVSHRQDFQVYEKDGVKIPRASIQSSPPLAVFRHRYERKVGAKGFFRVGGAVQLFKDGTKKYDYIGGKVEPTDRSTLHALKREILEEAGVSYTGNAVFQGITIDGDWATYLYELEPFKPKKGSFRPWHETLSVVPWLARMMLHTIRYDEERKPFNWSTGNEIRISVKGSLLVDLLADGTKHLEVWRGLDQVSASIAGHLSRILNSMRGSQIREVHTLIYQLRLSYTAHSFTPPSLYQMSRLVYMLRGYIVEGDEYYDLRLADGPQVYDVTDLFF